MSVYLKVVIGRGGEHSLRHHQVGTNSGAGACSLGSLSFKYLTLESIVFSSHARCSISRRRLRPAVPPIAFCSLRLNTVAVTQESGTRTS